MGRKIPGRKHRGVRDPEKQRKIRFNNLKDKINAPPSNSDEQQIPKSLSRLIELKEKVKDGRISLKRKRKHKRKDKPVTSHPNGIRQNFNKGGIAEKPLPVFTQKDGETDRYFMFRVNKICESVIKETAFENKYGVDIKRNAFTGQIEGVVKRKKDELELLIKKAKKEQKMKGKSKKLKENNVERLTKSQKKQIKLKEKKQNKENQKLDEFKNYVDQVKFGDVVHEPPTLSAPRKVQLNEKSMPGKRDLLLKSMIDEKTPGNINKTPAPKLGNKLKIYKQIDKKGKRKNLPHALRRQLDKQQKEVVDAYKLLKAKKYVAK